MIDNAALELGDPGQGSVPTCLRLASDKPVLGIGCVVLAKSAIGGIAGCLKITDHRLTCIVASHVILRLGGHAAWTAAGCTTLRIAVSIVSSTRKPPKAMQLGSP